MARYRNIVGEDRWVPIHGALVHVAVDGIIDFPDDWPYTIQTADVVGVEAALYEPVDTPAPKRRKTTSAPAEDDPSQEG